MTKTAQISNDQMIFSVQELKDKGFSYYKINQMVDQGILIKLNKKYYENANFDGEGSDFYYAYAFVPDGVVCLLSAAVYYNLSTYRPDAIDVAIPRKAKVSTLPDWPELNVCYFTDDRFDVGIETVEDGNNRFRIYDIEKTVTSELIAYSSELSNSIGKHTITLVRSSEAKLYNATAVSNRNSIIATIYNTQNYIKTMESSLSDEQKAAVNTIMAAKHSTNKRESNSGEEQPDKPRISKKIALLGFILGGLIYAFMYIAFVVIKGRVTSGSQIQYYTDVRTLGECYYFGRYKGVSRLLHSKKARSFMHRSNLNTKKQVQKIISSVDAACLHAGIDVVSVLITHSQDDEYWDVVDSIISNLKKKDIEADIIKISDETEEKAIAAAKDSICIFSSDTCMADIIRLTSILNEYGVKQIGNIFIGRL